MGPYMNRDKIRLEDLSDEELDTFSPPPTAGEGTRELLIEAELKIHFSREGQFLNCWEPSKQNKRDEVRCYHCFTPFAGQLPLPRIHDLQLRDFLKEYFRL